MERLINLFKKQSKLVIGLMSGTSLDGVDACLVNIKNEGLKTEVDLMAFDTIPYTKKEQQNILEACSPESSNVLTICELNFYLGKKFGEAALAIARKANVDIASIDLIGSHGQTIYHIPQKSTLQIGEPSVIKELTGVSTVADFRVMDVAAGGHGAPLVPYTEYLLFRSTEKTLALQNIGGIGNVTVLPKGCNINDVIAFDTGPGNMMMDTCVQIMTNGSKSYDKDGVLASKGMCNDELLQELMAIPVIKASPPKTTGREQFGYSFTSDLVYRYYNKGLSYEDILNTLTRFTARSISYNYKKHLGSFKIDEVIIGGGGSFNLSLLRMIAEELHGIKVLTNEDIGLRSDAKEAIAFAILANETISGNKNNVPSVTGARQPVVMGKIIP